MYNQLQDLVQQSNVIALSKITKVRATQLMTIRKKFRSDIRILVIKNKVAQRAFDKVKNVKGLENLAEKLEGQCALMFTSISPLKLNLILNKNRVFLSAKGGDIATKNITIPSGNTGLTPGPVLSEFKESNVQTRIEQGSIWVSKDTIVASPGTIISAKLASLMSKLNIKPIEAGISIHAAIEEGLFLNEIDLKIDLSEYTDKLTQAFRNAIVLSTEASYITTETLIPLLLKAQSSANALVSESGYLSRDTAPIILTRARTIAEKLAAVATKNGYTPIT
jgi:large subunit ribosomal protein L10